MSTEQAKGLFNINHYVRVKLTDHGRDHLWKPEHAWRMRFIKEDADGWSEWQLWELASIFGPLLGNGRTLPFETEIEILAPPTTQDPKK